MSQQIGLTPKNVTKKLTIKLHWQTLRIVHLDHYIIQNLLKCFRPNKFYRINKHNQQLKEEAQSLTAQKNLLIDDLVG